MIMNSTIVKFGYVPEPSNLVSKVLININYSKMAVISLINVAINEGNE